MVDEFIKELCLILGIETPTVSYDDSEFTSDKIMAKCGKDGEIIYVRKMEKKDLTPDYFFEVAREIRRVWQIKTNSPMYINEKNTSNVLNKEAYDSQPAEVDANAFAGIVLLDCFGAEPDYTQFSQDTIKLIMDRMSDIDDEIQ